MKTNSGRKLLLSFALIIASAGYALFQYSTTPQPPAIATNIPAPDTSSPPITQTQPPPATTVKQTPAVSTPPPPTPTPTPAPTPTPTPAPKPLGQYKDGTYTGSPADAFYGIVQVKAIIQGGKIADVQFLQYPNDRQTSIMINTQAMPLLTSEAIQAQSAKVDIVSGATDSSGAFVESLGSALAQAK